MSCNCCNNEEYETAFAGTVLKLLVTPEATGFDIDDNEWNVEVKYGSLGKTLKVYEKSDMIRSDDGYIVLIDTEGISGYIHIIVTAYVPDSDIRNGFRKEVVKEALCNIMSV